MPGAPATDTPCLIALTEQARRAAGRTIIPLETWPFRVGRESRAGGAGPVGTERRGTDGPPANDLYLREEDLVYHISRDHFRIEREAAGYVLVDSGSLNGTIVEGVAVGGERAGGRVDLCDHDVIVVGSAASPYLFKFRDGR
jgi:pSer/pThr/pTyr-binding forkhead associated (FHA) protein